MKTADIPRNEADTPNTPDGTDAVGAGIDFADFEYSDWSPDAEGETVSRNADDWLSGSADDELPGEGPGGDADGSAGGDYFDRLNDADIEFILSLGENAGSPDDAEGESAELTEMLDGFARNAGRRKVALIAACAVVAVLGLGGVTYGYASGALSNSPGSVLQAPASSASSSASSSSASSTSGLGDLRGLLDSSMARVKAGVGQVSGALDERLLAAKRADEERDSGEEDRAAEGADAGDAEAAADDGGGNYEGGGEAHYDSNEGYADDGNADQGGYASNDDGSNATGGDDSSNYDGSDSGSEGDYGYSDVVDDGGADAGGEEADGGADYGADSF